ncbi:vWA domain-containing protein [Nocardioides sp. P5_C9_2]
MLPASPASAAVTIEAPVAPRAGVVNLTGTVGVAPGEVTTVLYVVDATSSTESPPGADCSGNGVPGGPEDDLNADASVGDILDCEIAGIQALNGSLAGSSGLQVGLVAFANQAAAADLDPAGSATFLPPGFTGGDPRPRINTVSSSVVRDRIGLYDPRDLGGSGSGTAFNSGISVALSTLATAPAGPKWIMFLSDGQAAIDDSQLVALRQSGVRLRSFGIGTEATCAPFASLYKMASATGESCTLVPQPASLSAGLTGSQPDAVNGVTVSIDKTSVAATVDAVGGWKASFTLGAGTYTATATATLASGATQRTQRTFTVEAIAGGPAAGTVTPGPGALQATGIKVTRPKPSRQALPKKVAGRVGRPVDGLTTAPQLAGATVQLQARPSAGAPWVKVGQDSVDRQGKFVLKWKPQARLRLLQVVLVPPQGFAESAAAVPPAKISACKVVKRGGGWTVTCRTTVKSGSVARLLAGAKVVDKARVRKGGFRLDGKGKTGAHTIDITVGKKGHVRLAL